MKLLPTLRTAGSSLLRNKMRAFLTTLGIIIGVSAVIAMVAIGEGARARVAQTFESMGTNLLVVLPGTSASGGLQGGFGSQPTITWDDVAAMRLELRSVREVAPALRTAAVVQAEEQNWTTSVTGTGPEYLRLRNWEVTAGRPFDEGDVEGGAKVVLLGRTVAERLYGEGARPVGQAVRIKRVPYEVVGVLASKGQSPMGQDNDDIVLMPHTVFRSRLQGGLGTLVSGPVFLSARDASETGQAERQVRALLRDRHRLPAEAEDDFSIRNLSEIASAQQEGAAVLTTLLASIAAVALLVGGIGIMNIMLVSVTERTREIGLRMAVGARPRDVLWQFLLEALALSLAGGALGVAVGLIGGTVLAHQFQWPMIIRPSIVLVAVGFSALVGLVFGLFPARRAARLDPIDALRFE